LPWSQFWQISRERIGTTYNGGLRIDGDKP
jgi:hypothetical protein